MRKNRINCISRFALFVFISLFLLAFFFHPVSADIAPPPPPESGNILPGQQTTNVRMVSEYVLLDVAATSGDQMPYANVNATFTMRNQADQEEEMNVRFPLNLLFPMYQSDLEECPYPEGNFPQISNFQAQVNGKAIKVTTLYETKQDKFGDRPEINVACWASFPVVFPAQEDTTIDVSYSAQGYFAWNSTNLVQFPYVMVTGARWANTIGTADITIRAPYEFNKQNLMDAYPETSQIEGNEIHWHFVDIEPEINISATIVNPVLWGRVQKELKNLGKDPNDGESWGRLGKVYKEIIMMSRGYRWDAGGLEIFNLSRQAYEKAVTLLPEDADWHYGYGELLNWNFTFPSYGSAADQRNDLVKAAEQFYLALEISPNHTRTLKLLETFGTNFYNGDQGNAALIDLSGPKPVFLILTTTPTAHVGQIQVPSETPLPSPTQTVTATPLPQATRTITITVTASPSIATNTSTPVIPTQEPTSGVQNDSKRFCGSIFLPAIGLLLLALFRYRLPQIAH